MRRPTGRNVAIAATAALAAALALVWAQRAPAPGEVTIGAQRDGEAQRSAAARSDAPAPAAPTARGEDHADAYALDYRFEMTADFGGGGEETLTLRLEGTLELAAPVADPGRVAEGAWQPARLRTPRLELDAVARRVLGLDAGAADAAFSAPFAAHVRPDGRVDAVRLDAEAPFAARSLLAAIAYASQRAAGPAGARAWQADERDVNGSYRADYALADGGRVDKRWRIGQGDDPPSRLARISAGQASYRLRDGALDALDYSERGRAATGSLDPSTYLPFAIDLRLRREGAVDAAWARAVRPAALASFDAGDAPERPERRPTTRSYDAIVADAASRAGTMDAGAHASLRNEWTALLSADSHALDATEAALRAGHFVGEQRRMAVEALVGARTPEAQDKVGAMVNDAALAEALRFDLLAAVALMTRPTPALVTALERLAYAPQADGVAQAAVTTLGASAAMLAEQAPADAAEVVARLVSNARHVLHPPADAPTPPVGVRTAWLAGLGNTGDAQALPEILAALHDDAEPVRAQAALSLRRYPAAACLDAMVEAMATERSVHVRENLVDAARFMGAAAMAPFVEKALRFDRSTHVRLAAAYAIAAWSTAAPGLRKVLAAALADETSPQVAEALQSYLARGNLAGDPEQAPVKLGHPAEAP